MPIKRKVLANLLTGVLGLSDTSSSCSPYPMAEKNSFAAMCPLRGIAQKCIG